MSFIPTTSAGKGTKTSQKLPLWLNRTKFGQIIGKATPQPPCYFIFECDNVLYHPLMNAARDGIRDVIIARPKKVVASRSRVSGVSDCAYGLHVMEMIDAANRSNKLSVVQWKRFKETRLVKVRLLLPGKVGTVKATRSLSSQNSKSITSKGSGVAIPS